MLLTGLTALARVAPGAEDAVEAIARPSKDITLSFLFPGKIAKVLVKEGDAVEVASVLVRQDAAAEEIRLAQLKAEADNTAKIKMAEARLAQKKALLEHLETAAKRNAASPLELDRARLDAALAHLALVQAEFEHAQAALKHDEAKLRLDRMALGSPIAGKVEELFVHEGETVDKLDRVVRLVKIDPLWIDAAVPLAKAVSLRPGDPAAVHFEGKRKATIRGTVIHIGAFADAGSETLTVRVEIANPSGRPAGEHVRVRFAGADRETKGTAHAQ